MIDSQRFTSTHRKGLIFCPKDQMQLQGAEATRDEDEAIPSGNARSSESATEEMKSKFVFMNLL